MAESIETAVDSDFENPDLRSVSFRLPRP